jgi:adenine-specific DNA-methyltransferase
VEDVRQYISAPAAARRLRTSQPTTVLFHGDCLSLLAAMPNESVALTVSSPPYCMGKEYERDQTVEDFVSYQKKVLPEIVRVTKPGGSICWQVGYHVAPGGATYPLDFAVFSVLQAIKGIVLRNRIVWTFGHGFNASNKFSGRHETVLWFTKGNRYVFDLDPIREPQKYPGKKQTRGPRKGQYSCNPLGKNPGDVWSIPNVKAKHVEKLNHPCQFPVALVDRLVRSLCPSGDLVFDPYMGSGSSGVAAILNGRRFLGAETKAKYVKMAVKRLMLAQDGTVPHRPVDKPIFVPGPGLAVARRPAHFVEYSR